MKFDKTKILKVFSFSEKELKIITRFLKIYVFYIIISGIIYFISLFLSSQGVLTESVVEILYKITGDYNFKITVIISVILLMFILIRFENFVRIIIQIRKK